MRALLALVLLSGCLPGLLASQFTPDPPPPPPPVPYSTPAPAPPPPTQVGTAPPTSQPPPPADPAAQQPYPPPQQPYPQQPYPQQPYPQQPYPPGPPPPGGATPAPVAYRSHLHDGEVIGDFAAIGTLAAVDILVRQDVQNGSAGTFILLAGVLGGSGVGWLLTQNYPIDAGSSHATTLGLLVGAANGALLIEPTGWNNADHVLSLLLLGSAIGGTGGFIYGQVAHLSPGQSTFIGTATLVGSATAALTATLGSNDGQYGGWENTTLALGLDAGVIAGALIAPHLDWSARRANIVLAATGAGALAGGLIAGLASKPKPGESVENNGDLIAGCMTAGLWGGLGLGILMTSGSPPDPRFAKPAASSGGASTSFAPWIGDRRQLGVMAGGSW